MYDDAYLRIFADVKTASAANQERRCGKTPIYQREDALRCGMRRARTARCQELERLEDAVGFRLGGVRLQRGEFGAAFFGERQQGLKLVFGKRRAFRRSLDLDKTALARDDEIGVGIRG